MGKKIHFDKYPAGIISLFLLTYLGGIWQRPLFLCEYAAVLPGLENASYFMIRLPYTLAALAAVFIFGLWARKSSGEKECGIFASSVLLLTPAVYLTITMPGLKIAPAALIAGTLPWCMFLPQSCRGLVKGFRNMPTSYRNTGIILAAAGVLTGITAGWWIAIFPALSWFFAYGLWQDIRSRSSIPGNRAIMLLSGMVLSAAIVIFVIHISNRFGFNALKKARFYAPGEFFAAPVLAFVVSAIWWRMSAKTAADNLARKFVYFCVGAAFPLLALHGALPYQMLRNHAPENFLRNSIGRISGDDTLLIADRRIAPALHRVCRQKVMILEDLTADAAAELLTARQGDAAIVTSSSAALNRQLPPAMRRWRSGNFIVRYWGAPKIIIKEKL